jgi:hypothetical protein
MRLVWPVLAGARTGPRAYSLTVIDRTYLERGRPVAVVTRWGPGGGPRNVLIRRDDGRLVVRPFRGLRKPAENSQAQLSSASRAAAKTSLI